MRRLGLRVLLSWIYQVYVSISFYKYFEKKGHTILYADLIEMLLQFLISQVYAKLLKTAREVWK